MNTHSYFFDWPNDRDEFLKNVTPENYYPCYRRPRNQTRLPSFFSEC